MESCWGEQTDPFGGDVINAYNDGPTETGTIMGPFYELETSSPAAFLDPGASRTHIQEVYHLQGDRAHLESVLTRSFRVVRQPSTRHSNPKTTYVMQTQTHYVIGIDFPEATPCGASSSTRRTERPLHRPSWPIRAGKRGFTAPPARNQYRQHPLDYTESLERCIREALSACPASVARQIRGISFDTTASTPCG